MGIFKQVRKNIAQSPVIPDALQGKRQTWRKIELDSGDISLDNFFDKIKEDVMTNCDTDIRVGVVKSKIELKLEGRPKAVKENFFTKLIFCIDHYLHEYDPILSDLPRISRELNVLEQMHIFSLIEEHKCAKKVKEWANFSAEKLKTNTVDVSDSTKNVDKEYIGKSKKPVWQRVVLLAICINYFSDKKYLLSNPEDAAFILQYYDGASYPNPSKEELEALSRSWSRYGDEKNFRSTAWEWVITKLNLFDDLEKKDALLKWAERQRRQNQIGNEITAPNC